MKSSDILICKKLINWEKKNSWKHSETFLPNDGTKTVKHISEAELDTQYVKTTSAFIFNMYYLL